MGHQRTSWRIWHCRQPFQLHVNLWEATASVCLTMYASNLLPLLCFAACRDDLSTIQDAACADMEMMKGNAVCSFTFQSFIVVIHHNSISIARKVLWLCCQHSWRIGQHWYAPNCQTLPAPRPWGSTIRTQLADAVNILYGDRLSHFVANFGPETRLKKMDKDNRAQLWAG